MEVVVCGRRVQAGPALADEAAGEDLDSQVAEDIASSEWAGTFVRKAPLSQREETKMTFSRRLVGSCYCWIVR